MLQTSFSSSRAFTTVPRFLLSSGEAFNAVLRRFFSTNPNAQRAVEEGWSKPPRRHLEDQNCPNLRHCAKVAADSSTSAWTESGENS